MNRARWRTAAALMSCCAAAALAGCGSLSDGAQDRALTALFTEPPASRPTTTKPAPPVRCANPYESRPPSVLPTPGAMPEGTFMRTIQRRGDLVVGVDQNSLGLGFFNPLKSRVEGFDIDHAREVARAIFGDPRRIRYKAVLTRQREGVIMDGEVDMVASAFSITCDRRRRIAFSDVYYRARQRLLVPRRSTVTSLADLRGQKVCATQGSTSIERVAATKAQTGAIPLPVPLRSDCLVHLQEGLAGAITSDDAILFGLQKQDPQTKIVGPSLNLERYGLGINKAHPEFVSFVNAVLARMRRSGRAEQIRRRWLTGLPAPPGAARTSAPGSSGG